MAVSIMSRYRAQALFNAQDGDGASHPTVGIRRHTPAPADAVDYQHRVTGVEDLEYLAWRYFGDGQLWWRIADANGVRFPLDVRPGDAVAVPTNRRPEMPRRDRVF